MQLALTASINGLAAAWLPVSRVVGQPVAHSVADSHSVLVAALSWPGSAAKRLVVTDLASQTVLLVVSLVASSAETPSVPIGAPTVVVTDVQLKAYAIALLVAAAVLLFVLIVAQLATVPVVALVLEQRVANAFGVLSEITGEPLAARAVAGLALLAEMPA